MEITLTTPALLFPAISLLLLAYTNRFLMLAQLIRELHRQYVETKSEVAKRQIDSLRRRVRLIKWMQVFGVLSFILCSISMSLLFFKLVAAGEACFGVSLVTVLVSLLLSLWEVAVSVDALEIELEDMQETP